MKYVVLQDGTIHDTETDEQFPNEEVSERLENYVQWCAAGNIPLVETAPPLKQIQETDIDFIRVTEDLVDALVRKGLLSLSDIPQDAQDKLLERKQIRNGK